MKTISQWLAAVVVAGFVTSSFGQIILQNNFDGNAGNDIGPAFTQFNNGVGSLATNNTDPATGLISFARVGTSGTPSVGLVSEIGINAGAGGFTVTWVVNSASANINPHANGWFFGVQTNNIGLWNAGSGNVNGAVGLRISQTELLEYVVNPSTGVSATALTAAQDFSDLADGFTVSLTLNNNNTWSATTAGLTYDVSTGGSLVGITYSDFASSLYASTFLQFGLQNQQMWAQYDSVTITAVPEPTAMSLIACAGAAILFIRRRRMM